MSDGVFPRTVAYASGSYVLIGRPMKYCLLVWGLFAVTRSAAVFLLSDNSDSQIYARYAEALRGRGAAAFFAEGTVEYPALAVAAMLPPSYLADALPDGVERVHGRRLVPPTGTAGDRYQVAFQLLLLPCDALLFVAVGRVARRLYPGEPDARHAARLLVYVLATAALAPILYDRLDLAVGGFALAAVAAFAAGRPGLMFPVLAAGVLFKIVPGVLLAAAVLFAAARGPGKFLPNFAKQAAVAAAWTALGPVFVYAAVGPGAFKFLGYHADRGVQIQASYGWPLPLLDPRTDVVLNYGSHNYRGPLAGTAAAASTGILLACLAASIAAAAVGVRRFGPTPERLAAAFAAAWLAYILGNKVGSPQYLLWLAPVAPLLPLDTARGRRWAAGFVGLCAWTTLGFPYLYGHMLGAQASNEPSWAGPTPLALGQLAVQAVLLVAVTAVAWERTATGDATRPGSV